MQIRGVTRNGSSDASLALQKRGVELIEADLDNPASLVAAFKVNNSHKEHLQMHDIANVNTRALLRIYALTDFWEPYVRYLQSGREDAWIQAMLDEVRRGQNVVDAASQTLETLNHFVLSSLPSADEISSHELSKVYHHEGKAEIVRYIQQKSMQAAATAAVTTSGEDRVSEADSHFKQLASITTVFWCGYYMENFVNWHLNPYLRPKEVCEVPDAATGLAVPTPSNV